MLLSLVTNAAKAQEPVEPVENDTLTQVVNNEMSILIDSAQIPKKPVKDMNLWCPNPKRALWLALVYRAADRYTTENTGNSRWYMADSLVVCTP